MSEPQLWMPDEEGAAAKLHAPATLRNREAIATVLADVFQPGQTVLEIASGSGEHVAYFAAAFPDVTFCPSDMSPASCRSIAAWSQESGLANIREPLLLDVLRPAWPISHVDAVLCINMVHISPWAATHALFAGCTSLLEAGKTLYLYGPYLRNEMTTASGNVQFDASLQSRNAEWGLRHVSDMDDVAEKNGFYRKQLTEMPSNNLSLVYNKLD